MNIDALTEMMVAAARNSELENLHAGQTPVSKTGDYSDVYVVTPDRNIPWTELSRISDEEMGPLKDSIRENVKFQLNFLMENGMQFKIKKDSPLEKFFKQYKIVIKKP